MAKTSIKKNSNSLLRIFSLVVVLLALIGVIAYVEHRDKSEPTNSRQKNCTTYNSRITEQCAEDYIGLSADEATDKAKKNNMQPLTVLVDGKNQGFTDIFRPAPIYFEVNNNAVTKAYFEHDRS